MRTVPCNTLAVLPREFTDQGTDMKTIILIGSCAWLMCGCATQMVEHDANKSCADQGKKPFIFNSRQNGIPLVLESASAMVLCVGPEDITHLPDSFGADAVSAGNLNGAGIFSVSPGSVADRAAIKSGDIVYEFAGTSISNARELRSYIDRVPTGQLAVVKLRRKGRELEVAAQF